MNEQGLVSLDEGGWQVADGEPDVRGWGVFTIDHRKIGEVDDLLADPTAQKVRYLTIDLDHDLIDEMTVDDSDHTVRVSIEHARVQEDGHEILLDITADALTNMSTMAKVPAQNWRDEQMRITRAAEELRVGKRTVQAGEVEVTKHVETERVRQPVTLRREEVQVERRPVQGDAASRDVSISAQDIRVPITEEEAVVEKRPVVKEEVIISKRPVEKRETVETDVQKERIDVQEHGETRPRDRNTRDRNR